MVKALLIPKQLRAASSQRYQFSRPESEAAEGQKSSQASVHGIGSGCSIRPAGAGNHPHVASSKRYYRRGFKSAAFATRDKKSMSRRSGQNSKPFKAGKWWRVRVRFDVPGVEERQQKNLKVCPIASRLSKPQIERLAKERRTALSQSLERRGAGLTFGGISQAETPGAKGRWHQRVDGSRRI